LLWSFYVLLNIAPSGPTKGVFNSFHGYPRVWVNAFISVSILYHAKFPVVNLEKLGLNRQITFCIKAPFLFKLEILPFFSWQGDLWMSPIFHKEKIEGTITIHFLKLAL